MELNVELKNVFKQYNIPYDEAYLYLLGLHYRLKTEIIPEKIKKQINISKIVEREYNIGKLNTVAWNYPLFDGQVTDFEWVNHWREEFRNINRERAGDLQACKQRMRRIFKENIWLTKETAYEARDLYMGGLNSGEYLKSAHKFIYEGSGESRSSMLITYAKQLEESHQEILDNLQKHTVL